MSLFSLFSGRTAAAHESKGDERAAARDWGRAKIAYESALEKIRKQSPGDAVSEARLEEKIARSREFLAEGHHREAAELVQAGALAEARELAHLGLELTVDRGLRSRLEGLLEDIDRRLDAEVRADSPILSYEEPDESGYSEPDDAAMFAESDEEYFTALCAALPEEVQEAYHSYGEDFAAGYLALNEGDFEKAADYLQRAMAQHPSPESYIPLELATAYLNLGKRRDARELLLNFVDHHPGALPAYQMLCEIHWEDGAFDRAERLLEGLPSPLADSVAAYLLRGETRFQAGDVEGAKRLYRQFIQTYGWNEGIARSLARAHEAVAETGEAIHLYGEMMRRCSGCGSRVDADIKHKFADLSFAAGDHSTRILELYLSLAQEVPHIAADCYEKVSRIYGSQGNPKEERRFRSIAVRARGQG